MHKIGCIFYTVHAWVALGVCSQTKHHSSIYFSKYRVLMHIRARTISLHVAFFMRTDKGMDTELSKDLWLYSSTYRWCHAICSLSLLWRELQLCWFTLSGVNILWCILSVCMHACMFFFFFFSPELHFLPWARVDEGSRNLQSHSVAPRPALLPSWWHAGKGLDC